MTLPRLALPAAALLLVVGGCGDPAPAPPGPAPTARTVRLLVDDADVGEVTVTERVPLVDVLPEAARDPAAWVGLLGVSADGKRRLGIPEPTTRYDDHTFALFPDAEGRPVLGVFRRPREDWDPSRRARLSGPQVRLVDVAEVHVVVTPVPGPPPAPPVILEVDGAVREVGPDVLARLPAADATEPAVSGAGEGRGGRGRMRRRGWQVADVLTAAGLDLARVRSVVFVDTDGAEHGLPMDAGTGASTYAVLKRNRRGEYQVLVRPTEGGEPERTYRNLDRLRITTAP